MRVTKQTSRGHVTDASEATANDARRENALSKKSLTTPALYYGQSSHAQLLGWEIHRFGDVVSPLRETGCLTEILAGSAGKVTLVALVGS